ncbi:MAG TPA: 50S ribosomal protein L32 [Candidatus Paceibacterota bacterium]|nr:50S ribosomal protein L32 [Candidatus Paceibacterota bacterium]
MSVRMRHTRAHTGNRRSHHALSEARLSTCAKCGAKHLRHHACEACGTYRGKQVMNVLKDAEKKIKNAERLGAKQEKAAKASKKEETSQA